MVVAALSTVVEWYDFTLYLYFSTVLARAPRELPADGEREEG